MKIDHAKSLNEAFRYRTIGNHAKPHMIEKYPDEGHNTFLIFDPGFSRKILTSKSFISFNYFQPGLERSHQQNRPLEWMQSYLDSALLFKSGEAHRLQKKSLHELANQLEIYLIEWQPRLEVYFDKRQRHIRSAIDFSHSVTRICLGLLISRLLSIPLRLALKSLEMRANIWFIWFHPARQAMMNEALKHLYQDAMPPDQSDTNYFPNQLAQSLMVMGYDPLVASICASISEGNSNDFAAQSYRFCPTSFVSRVCDEDIQIDGVDFKAGDICFTSLVPAADQPENDDSVNARSSKSLAYGAGPHICVGKSLSLTILKIAQHIYQQSPPGFTNKSIISPDGAFLSFKNQSL